MAASRSNHGQCGHKTLGTFGIGNASETILSQHCFGYSTYTGNAEHGGGSTQSIGEWARTHTGVMYRQMFSFEGDKDLPTPVKAILHPSRERFLAVDRGTVRGGNDRTFDSRAHHYARWLDGKRITFDACQNLSNAHSVELIAVYVGDVIEGNSCTGATTL